MAGFQPPSPISNSLPLPPPTPQYFSFPPPPPTPPTWNSEEWWLLHIKVATATVVLAIFFVVLLVKVCKCGRKSENQSVIELQSTSEYMN